ncbi:AAA family ATPase [Winogradskya humida]|uniref:Adenylylsulfate kinase n=1 Tax=Winogradskya humida TaxID=113566 RepID=A0ABQ3ZHP5_9ACTN|nr:AAA family ATPase [Actinoplanes humidus]GIE18073.1 hypothetical protein Ahu01nite_011750 [Actinoplanes humidus]
MADARALLITGTVGAGKTTVAEALGDLLIQDGIPSAIIDVDWLRRSWPAPPGDPFNGKITLRNLHAVAATYLEAGARRLVLAGVAESAAERDAYQVALGVPLTVCRLRVDLPTVRQRLTRRQANDAAGLGWFLKRSGELDQILDQARIEDVTVDAGTGPPRQVAELVMTAIDW